MAQPGKGTAKYVRLSGGDVWYDPATETDIHVTFSDEDLVHPVSGKTGMTFVVLSNPRSANFDPKTFNTLRDLLRRFDRPHPPAGADESIPRRLDKRSRPLAARHRPVIPSAPKTTRGTRTPCATSSVCYRR